MNIDIKKILKAYNLRQKELAAILKVQEGSISNYVNGRRKISLDKMIEIAKYLNVPLETLVGNEDTLTIQREDLRKIKEARKIIDDILSKYK